MSDLQIEDFPQAYRGLTLSGQRTATGAQDKSVVDFIRVARFDFSRLQIRDQRAALELGTGGDLGDAAETFRYISVAGMIVGSTGEKLADLVSRIFQTFDIEEAVLASPTTKGLTAFTFTAPTELAGYSPYQTEQFLVRPAGYPTIFERISEGLSRPFALELVAEDPRRYRATATSKTLNSGNGFSAACPNWDANMGRQVYPTLTITMSGAGNAAFTVTNGSTSLVLDLSGLSAANVVTVDMATGVIKLGSTHRADLRTSTVATFFGIPRNGATLSATNTGGVSSVVIDYREARA